ncbi:SMP-30/gluconolactonase/LRE family protein [Actinomycetospora soli]|uniref:SMP-30/gluconolactonase/LRE family protein n=1 Tax=Actinomycetospora soli TaxID=2893887 RepID=UPI001E526DC9|nr:SMP-30/gluconolactonase/LRE family protein [Actinomycetospora soli]MCD2186570.1 SMP-30/gluconolactonase/LRE family protein [Actinomycetospora soli]
METLLDDLAMVEGARWHDGRLWFAHWGVGEVIAVDLDGKAEVVAPGPEQMGWAFDWLPDGRRVTTAEDTVTVDGDVLRDGGGNEVVVDPQGRVYVNGFDGSFTAEGFPEPGWIDLVSPDGTSRRVAEDIHFPNGMVVTPDGSTLVVAESVAGRLSAFDIAADGSLTGRRVWADGLGPDGIAIDADGAIWAQTADTFAHSGDPSAPAGAVVRVLDGGKITHRIETPMPCFACAVGDGKLFLLCNEWEGIEKAGEVLARRSSRVFVVDLDDVPRV